MTLADSFVRTAFATGLALALAGCGSGGSGTTATGAGTGTTTAAAGPAGWKATDACATLDKGVVAATLGSAVSEATLSAVKDQGGGFPLYSQCGYKLADGRMLVFGTGQYTDGRSLAEQVADMKRQAAMISSSAPIDVPGLGKAAIWAGDVHALYAFFGDGRYVSATLMQTDFRAKSDAVAKAQADDTAILRKAGA